MPREEFEDLFKSARRWRRVSPGLKALLDAAYVQIERNPANLSLLTTALEQLLSFLASEAGRTDANCTVTDAFFFSLEERGRWAHIPKPLSDIMSDMGGTLHDAVHAPHVARNYESLPEQLLERLRKTTK